jgi:hypothetical protein
VQAQALSAAGCRRIFEEAASGGRWDRPELHRMLDQLREGDVVVVWKLDRLSRSLKACSTSWSEPKRAGGPVTLAFCWAHWRRQFFDLARSPPAPIATEALKRIAELYQIEAEIRGSSADQRDSRRPSRWPKR